MKKKYFTLNYFFILFIFFIYYFLTKKFSLINFDSSIYIDYLWRIHNGQIPHIDFNSPFGPFIYYQYYFYIFFCKIFSSGTYNFSYENIVNYSDIFKIFVSFFVITYLFFFHYVFRKFVNFNRYLLYLIIFFLGSFFISNRGYGYTFSVSLTSYYNMFIEGALILTIYVITFLYLYTFKSNKEVDLKYFFTLAILGFFNFQLIFLKITGLILVFPIFFYFFTKNDYFKKIIRFYLLGYLFSFFFSIFFFGHEILINYFNSYLDLLKIRFLDSETITLKNNPIFFAIIKNVLIDLFALFILLLVLRYSKKHLYFELYKIKKKILIISLFYILCFFCLQLFSNQIPESNLKGLFLLLSLIIVITDKKNFFRKRIYNIIILIFPAWIIFKNIIFSFLLFFLSFFITKINFIEDFKYSFLSENKILKKIELKLEYSKLGAYEKLLYLSKTDNIEIEKIISLINQTAVVSSYNCHFPFSYLIQSKPSKNSNLYWEYGVTFGKSINSYNKYDDTTHFLICLTTSNNFAFREKLYESLFLKRFFTEIYYDKGSILLQKKF